MGSAAPDVDRNPSTSRCAKPGTRNGSEGIERDVVDVGASGRFFDAGSVDLLAVGRTPAAMELDVYAGLFGDDLDAVADRLEAAAAAARADSLRTAAPKTDALPLDLDGRHAS